MTKRKKRILTVVIVLVIILAVLAAGGLYVYNYLHQKMGKIQTKQLNQEKVVKSEVKEETKKIFSGYTTIALFGLDNRSTGNYDTGHSDVIIIMNINNDTKDMQMVSVYRDTYLNIQGENDHFFKSNGAYQNGGPEQAISMLNVNLDLDIDNYISFDFETVADAIDALGGVDIDIESTKELGWLNKYIDHTDGILGTHTDHVDGTGVQTLSGVQAVAYGRIRYTDGSDFRRAERHRLVLSELIKKAKKASLSDLNKLMDVVFPEIKTDLSEKKLLQMVSVMKDYDLKNSRGFPFERCSVRLDNSMGGWVDVPCDLETNVKELHEYLFGVKDYEPTEKIKDYSMEIISRTGADRDDAWDDGYDDEDHFDGKGGVLSDEELEKANKDSSDNDSDKESSDEEDSDEDDE